MDLNESLDHLCELKTVNNYLLTTARVCKVTEEYIEITNPYGRMPLLSCGTMTKVMILDSNFPLLIGSVYLSTEQFARISNLQRAEEFEKRTFFRVDLFIEVRLYPEGTTEEMFFPKKEKVSPPDSVPAVLINASPCGMRFHSKKYFEAGDRMVIGVNLYDRQSLFTCVVRRVSCIKERREYGCELEKYSTRDGEALGRFLFEKQREQIRHYKKTDT